MLVLVNYAKILLSLNVVKDIGEIVNKEQKIIIELLKYNDDSINNELVLKNTDINWINILGYLSYHRIAGLAFEKINKIGARSFDYPFYLTLYMINSAQKQRTIEQNKWINIIAEKLDQQKIDYVFLKGAILNNTIFKYGERVSNDIDILVKKESINKLENIFNSIGFIEGKYDYSSKKIIEFTNFEKNSSILSRGEMAPFVIKNDNDFIETINLDINFSIDWLPDNNDIVNYFLKNKIKVKKYDGKSVYSLNYNDNLIELCVHFYKDASLIDIIKKRKILDLYKFIDIYYFIKIYNNNFDINQLYNEIKKYKLEKYVYFSLFYVISIFPDCNSKKIRKLMRMIKQDKRELNTIFDQSNESIEMITKTTIKNRIFQYNILKKYERKI